MRTLVVRLCLAILALSCALPANADLTIRTRLYTVAPTAYPSDESPVPTATGDASGFRHVPAPAAIDFGGVALRLEPGSAAWSGPLPGGVHPLADTVLPLGPSGHAVLRCIAKAQYMEPRADGTFELRQIPADAPDVPRYVLTFRVDRRSTGQVGLAVTCNLEAGVARHRESLPGVNMLVGRPQVDVVTAETTFNTPAASWQALLFRQAPDATGLLALLRLEDTPASTAPSARALHPQPPHRIRANIAATRTPDGATAAANRRAGAPVGYLLFDTGYWKFGSIAGPRPPAPATMDAAWQTALAHAGYQPARPDLPPQVILIHQRGFSFFMQDGRDGNGTSPTPQIVRESAFVTLAAYDHDDFLAGRQTLLWRVRADTRDVAPLADVLPGLAIACMSWIGTHQERPSVATVDLSAQAPLPSEPTPNAREFLSAIDQARIQALGEQGSRRYARRADPPLPPR